MSSLCGDSQIIQSNESIQADDEDNVDDFLTEEEDYTILDADESQLRSIKAVLDGKHLVVHGPPGTGKSQTIANLIANLLARGKRCSLFVKNKLHLMSFIIASKQKGLMFQIYVYLFSNILQIKTFRKINY